MARRPKKEKPALLAAMELLSLAQSDKGTLNETHCVFTGDQMFAFNGITAIGCPAPVADLNVLPNTVQLTRALARAGDDFQLTVTGVPEIHVKSSKFSAYVPCLASISDVMLAAPDAGQWPLTDEFKVAGAKAGAVSSAGAQYHVGASLCTRDGSLVGTDRIVVIEAWHGCSTPPGLSIPVTFFDVIDKIDRPIERFGFSAQTFTVHFEGGLWAKTQLFNEQWPNSILHLLDNLDLSGEMFAASKAFYEAVASLEPFTKTGNVFCRDGVVSTVETADLHGAENKVRGLPTATSAVSVKRIKAIAPFATNIGLTSEERYLPFYGSNVRGALSKISASETIGKTG